MATFKKALKEYDRIKATYGMGSIQEIKEFHKMMAVAPKALKEQIYQGLKQRGLTPKPSGYDKDGNPVFDPKDIAELFGISVADVHRELTMLQAYDINGVYADDVDFIQ